MGEQSGAWLISKRAATAPLSVATEIQKHLEKREQLERYVYGASSSKPPISGDCDPDCMLTLLLHSGDVQFNDMSAVNAVCRSCEDFKMASNHALTLMRMGKTDEARDFLENNMTYTGASERFQNSLATLPSSYTI